MRLLLDIELADRFDPTLGEVMRAVGGALQDGIPTSEGKKVKPLTYEITRLDDSDEDWLLLATTGRDLLVRGLQALHRERVAARNAQNSFANSSGQAALNDTAFGIAEVASMLRAAGAGPHSL